MTVSSTELLPNLDAILYRRRAGENIVGAAIDEIERLRAEVEALRGRIAAARDAVVDGRVATALAILDLAAIDAARK